MHTFLRVGAYQHLSVEREPVDRLVLVHSLITGCLFPATTTPGMDSESCQIVEEETFSLIGKFQELLGLSERKRSGCALRSDRRHVSLSLRLLRC